MKSLPFTIFLFLSINFIHGEHLDSQYELSVDCSIKSEYVTQQLVRERIVPPVYPRHAQRFGHEAVVSVVFDTNDKGEVINERISWQVSTLNEIDPSDTSLRKDFSEASLRSMSTAIYKAGKDNREGILSSKNNEQIIIFSIQGNENTFNLGTRFDRTLKRVKGAVNNISKIPKLIESIEEHLNSEELTNVQRGSLLYLKAFLIFTKSPDSEEIKPLLLEMKSLIDTDLPYGPNTFKVITFGSLLLGQIYINEQQWDMAIDILEEAIHSVQRSNYSLEKRFFSAHLQLGIAYYSEGNWCGAAKSWARAKMMADSKNTNYTFPEALEVYVNYANGRLDS